MNYYYSRTAHTHTLTNDMTSKPQQQTAAALAKLTENIQIKRLNLNKLYDDLNGHKSTPPATNLIKHVNFDDTDDEDNNINNEDDKKLKKPTKSKENQSKSPAKRKSATTTTTTTTTVTATVKPQVSRVKINTTKRTTLGKSTPPVVSNVHKIQLEFLRKKVITRKFAYIWLRKHFYSTSRRRSQSRLLLPSQLK